MEIERKKEPIGKKKIDANCKLRNWKIQAKFFESVYRLRTKRMYRRYFS